jgi:hypothetical protein
MPEEYELVQMRRDFALKHDELVAYQDLRVYKQGQHASQGMPV